MNNLKAKLQKFYYSKELIWALFVVGILLRLRQYVSNRSLWVDEAALAVSLVGRSFSGLLSPLEYGQTAPLGFLMVVKTAVQMLGPSEYTMRLFPLVAGILSLFLFHRVAVKFLDRSAVPLAVGILAISQPLIYFSSELKQYSVEVLITLVILCLAIRMWEAPPVRPAQTMLYGLWGAITIWFSYPAAFFLTGAAAVLGYKINKERKAPLWPLIAIFGLWLASILACYFFSQRYVSGDSIRIRLEDFWQEGFMPLVPSVKAVQWYMRTFFNTFEFPGGFGQSGLAAFAFIAGIVSLRLQKKTIGLGLLTVPILAALAASALRVYPFDDRLILYLVPLFILLVAEGTVMVKRSLGRSANFLGVAFVVLLLIKPAVMSLFCAVYPITREESRPVFLYLKERIQPEDTLYMYHSSRKAFHYYQLRYNFLHPYLEAVNSRDKVSRYIDDLQQLQGKARVWIFFTHVFEDNGFDERKFILNYLDRVGSRLDEFKVPAKGVPGLRGTDSAVYLYDLSKPFAVK